MIPDKEIVFLLELACEAVELAEDGQRSAGYQLLLAGLVYAGLVADGGAEWGTDLVRRYRMVCASYRQWYGPRVQ